MIVEIFSIVIIFVIVYGVLQNVKKRPYPPGPFQFPLVGTLPQIIACGGEGHEAFQKLAAFYGDVMTVRIGTLDMVVISSYKAAKEICSMGPVTDRYLNDLVSKRSFKMPLGNGLFFSSGDRWKVSRRFLIRNLRDFGFGKTNKMEDIINEQLAECVSRIKKDAQENNGVVKMDNRFGIPILNVFWSMVTGSTYSHDDVRLTRLLKIMREITQSGNFAASLALAYPILINAFPTLTGQTLFIEQHKVMHQFIKEIMDDHRKRLKKSIVEKPSSFVDVLVQEIDKNVGMSNSYFTDEHGIVMLMDMFVAGSETTSNILSFCVLYMLRFPKVQEKVRHEINATLSKSELPTIGSRERMVYTNAVILEILRHSVIIPVTPPRISVEDVNYNGMLIRKNVPILVNSYAILSDKELWGDPKEFRPERFIDKDGNFDKKLADHVISFGYGHRICPGQVLGETILFLFFTTLFQTFKVDPVPNQPLPTLDTKCAFTITPNPHDAVFVKID